MAEGSGTATGVDELVARVRQLTDDERERLAEARAGVDEAFHLGARRAAQEALAERGEAYFDAWLRIGEAVLPERLEELLRTGGEAQRAEAARWQAVARLVSAAVDDALLARCAADVLPPPALRELLGAWQAMLKGPSRT